MGVNLKDITAPEQIQFDDLKGRVIAVDALNFLYQFLASIRQADGTPLMDSGGQVTSHLSGLFYRTIRLMELGIKPVYVFDGKPPELKRALLKERGRLKTQAESDWETARQEGRIEDARKYASRTSRLTSDMIEDSKRLLSGMGIPSVQAPEEGEAECTYICRKGDAWAVGSQDYDSLLLGAPRVVRGLSLSGTFELSLIRLEDTLKQLDISREQLIDLAILVGTDFNEGIKGIGPKKALKIVREGKIDEYAPQLGVEIDSVRRIFLEPGVTDDYDLDWKRPKRDQVTKLLCDEHDFSENRVNASLTKLEAALGDMSQKDLGAWF